MKSLIFPGLAAGLAMALSASAAVAVPLYTYTYTFSGDPDEATFTTDPIPGVTTAETMIPVADIASYALTGSYWSGTTLSYVVLDHGSPGGTRIQSTSFEALSAGFGLTLADYTTPGTYADYGGGYNTLVVTAVTTTGVPEPLTLSLFGAGLVRLGALRRRQKVA